MWFTTGAQLRRPASIRADETREEPDTRAGALSNDAGLGEWLAEKLGIYGDAVRPTELGPTMNEEAKNEAC